MKTLGRTLTLLALALPVAGCEILEPDSNWGAMQVTVTDQDGAPVAGVEVARWDANQVRRSGMTDSNGVWTDSNVRKGNYRIVAEGTEGHCYVKPSEVAQCDLVVERGG